MATKTSKYKATTAVIKDKLVKPLAELSITFLCISLILETVFRDLTSNKKTRDMAMITKWIVRSSNVPPLFSIGLGIDP